MLLADIDTTARTRMHGWNHSAEFCKAKIARGEMIHLLAETTNVCDQDCEYCYTVILKLDKPHFHSRPLPGELVWEERKSLIDQAALLGAVTYDVVGAGEPLLDPLFFRQVEYAASKGMTPVIFTNGSILGHQNERRALEFANRLWDLGATVVVKWHSQHPEIHDRIVRQKGAGMRKDLALERLKKIGFAKDSATRLGIDNIIYQATLAEMPDCLRMCRNENIFLVCSTFIPSGRTKKANESEASWADITKVLDDCREIDEKEFGIVHSGKMPYLGFGKTCTQYMGLYVTILGESYGCVGMSETYGNVRDRSMESMWQERLPILQDYDGGCPPRRKFYEKFLELEKIANNF